jgi:hypothetical protein
MVPGQKCGHWSDEKPFYSDITAIELWALDVDGRNPLYHEQTMELEDTFG